MSQKRARRSSATLIVRAANNFHETYHDRMLVLLEQHNLDAWLQREPVGVRIVWVVDRPEFNA